MSAPAKGAARREPRVYVEQALEADTELLLDRERSHHLADVLRLDTGSHLVLFDGRGKDWPAHIIATGRQLRLRIDTARMNAAESPLRIALWQGLSQASRMDACLRQSVELGVHRIRPLSTARSQVRLDAKRAAKKLEHWRAIAISASEQSGRAQLPAVQALTTLADALAAHTTTPDCLALVLVPHAHATLGNVLPDKAIAGIDLLIGPESGLSDTEIVQACDAGFTAVRAGPRTLRTETAGPAAIAILQARFGDMLDR